MKTTRISNAKAKGKNNGNYQCPLNVETETSSFCAPLSLGKLIKNCSSDVNFFCPQRKERTETNIPSVQWRPFQPGLQMHDPLLQKPCVSQRTSHATWSQCAPARHKPRDCKTRSETAPNSRIRKAKEKNNFILKTKTGKQNFRKTCLPIHVRTCTSDRGMFHERTPHRKPLQNKNKSTCL